MKNVKNQIADEELKKLCLAILSFMMINSKTFQEIIRKENKTVGNYLEIRESIGEMGDYLYTILHFLKKPGIIGDRLSRLLGNHIPVDIRIPKLSEELIERLNSKSFLFK